MGSMTRHLEPLHVLFVMVLWPVICNATPLTSTVFKDVNLGDLTFIQSTDGSKGNLPYGFYKKGKKVEGPEILVMPPRIDFAESQLFVPITKHIDVLNPSIKDIIQIRSITSQHSNFQVSVFQQTALLPLSRIRIPIVFLPRTVGRKTSQIMVSTSVGDVTIKVVGIGRPNIYRVKAFTDITIPVDTRITPPIEVYNPYGRVFHVKEVFTTENFLHLSLPQNQLPQVKPEGTKLWQIEPHSSKYIINLSFMSPSAGDFHGYVHIKTEEHDMILPIEIKVVSEPLEQPDVLDFGTLTSSDASRRLPIVLTNLGHKPVAVTNIRASRADSRLHIDYDKGTMVPPLSSVAVANATYTGRLQAKISGKIFVYSNQTGSAKPSRLEVPYRARVLHGELWFGEETGRFPLDVFDPKRRVSEASAYTFGQAKRLVKEVRDIGITNEFSVPVKILSLKVHSDLFKIVGFTPGKVAAPNEHWRLCKLVFKPNSTSLILRSSLTISSNISSVDIPLHVYTGKLQLTSKSLYNSTTYKKGKAVHSAHSQGKVVSLAPVTTGPSGGLNFGLLALGETREHIFTLTNPNPIPITVTSATCSLPQVHVKLVRVRPSSDPKDQHKHQDITLRTDESVKVLIRLSARRRGPAFRGMIYISTSVEQLQISVLYGAVDGSVKFEVDPPKLDGLFPGKRGNFTLYANSSFAAPVTLYSVSCDDPRVYVQLTRRKLRPNVRHVAGWVSYDPALAQLGDDYMINLDSPCQDCRLLTPHTSQDLFRPKAADFRAVVAANRTWQALRRRGGHKVNLTLFIATNVRRKQAVSLRVRQVQPSLLMNVSLDFGLVAVNASKRLFVRLHNPSDSAVEVFPLQTTARTPPGMPDSHRQLINERGAGAFQWDLLSMKSFPMVVAPGESGRLVPVLFRPTQLGAYSSVLYLRNNVTRLSAVRVNGSGGKGSLSFIMNGPCVTHSVASDPGQLDTRKAEKQVAAFRSCSMGLDSRGNNTCSVRMHTHISIDLNASALGVLTTKDGSLFLASPNSSNATGSRHSSLLGATITRPFSLINSGNLPITILNFSLGQTSGKVCAGVDLCHGAVHGFAMQGCQILPIELKPRQTNAFRITYTPDFHEFSMDRQLVVGTSWGEHRIPVEVRLPKRLAPLIASIRPPTVLEMVSRVAVIVLALVSMGLLCCLVVKDLRTQLEASSAGILVSGRLAADTDIDTDAATLPATSRTGDGVEADGGGQRGGGVDQVISAKKQDVRISPSTSPGSSPSEHASDVRSSTPDSVSRSSSSAVEDSRSRSPSPKPVRLAPTVVTKVVGQASTGPVVKQSGGEHSSGSEKSSGNSSPSASSRKTLVVSDTPIGALLGPAHCAVDKVSTGMSSGSGKSDVSRQGRHPKSSTRGQVGVPLPTKVLPSSPVVVPEPHRPVDARAPSVQVPPLGVSSRDSVKQQRRSSSQSNKHKGKRQQSQGHQQAQREQHSAAKRQQAAPVKNQTKAQPHRGDARTLSSQSTPLEKSSGKTKSRRERRRGSTSGAKPGAKAAPAAAHSNRHRAEARGTGRSSSKAQTRVKVLTVPNDHHAALQSLQQAQRAQRAMAKMQAVSGGDGGRRDQKHAQRQRRPRRQNTGDLNAHAHTQPPQKHTVHQQPQKHERHQASFRQQLQQRRILTREPHQGVSQGSHPETSQHQLAHSGSPVLSSFMQYPQAVSSPASGVPQLGLHGLSAPAASAPNANSFAGGFHADSLSNLRADARVFLPTTQPRDMQVDQKPLPVGNSASYASHSNHQEPLLFDDTPAGLQNSFFSFLSDDTDPVELPKGSRTSFAAPPASDSVSSSHGSSSNSQASSQGTDANIWAKYHYPFSSMPSSNSGIGSNRHSRQEHDLDHSEALLPSFLSDPGLSSTVPSSSSASSSNTQSTASYSMFSSSPFGSTFGSQQDM